MKVQPCDVFNLTILAKTDPLEQGNLRYDWYIGVKRYSEQLPNSKWSGIIQLSMDSTHIKIDTNKIHPENSGLFQELMGNLSVRVYHEYDQRTISTELFTEVPPPLDKKEHQAGHDSEQELKDSGFHDVGRIYDDEEPPKDDISFPESVNYDSDDMTEEYGGDFEVSKFNEDGSFIGLYGDKRVGGKGGNKPPPPSHSEV